MTTLPKLIMLLGSGELGKEFCISAKRLGCKVIACDRYKNAPAMQIADISEEFDMNDNKALTKIINKYKPDIIVPEIEALNVNTLIDVEKTGITVIPNAKATAYTMNRDKIRDHVANKLKIKTAKYMYANNIDELKENAKIFNFPIVIKPVMSSSGKGQSLVKSANELEQAWDYAIKGSRGNSSKIIIEEFINFEQEITLLTIKQKNSDTLFCEPIGHEQKNGDYQLSWQPAHINDQQITEAKIMAKKITESLGGYGLFGVEFFICKDQVIFSELSPRPHDTGLVTIISQKLNEFDLHLRAILGLPIPKQIISKPSASKVILAEENLTNFKYIGIEDALSDENINVLIFGKPIANPNRRMGVVLAIDVDIENAKNRANFAASKIKIISQESI